MTVINKLTQTLEMLKSCESNCNTFSMDTNDQNAKQMYKQLAQNLKQCSDMLQDRVNYVVNQEPEYAKEISGMTTAEQASQNMTSTTQGSQNMTSAQGSQSSQAMPTETPELD